MRFDEPADDLAYEPEKDISEPGVPTEPDPGDADGASADGPHQGRRDIGGYVPTSIVAAEDSSEGENIYVAGTNPPIIATSQELAEGSNEFNMKGLSWFGFETTNYNLDTRAISLGEDVSHSVPDGSDDLRADGDSNDTTDNSAGSSGYFTQMAWANTRSAPSDAYFVRNDAETTTSGNDVSALGLVGRDDGPVADSNFDQVIYGTSDDDVLVGESGADLIFGFEGNDLIHGGDGDDVIVGVVGYNDLYGDDGDDEVVGGTDNDDLFGGFGNDILGGEAGNDFLAGNEGHDLLMGNDGNDDLFGGEGHDVLVGGLGLDVLTGGSGIDIFRWGGNWDGGKDTVTDFEIDVDQFQFVKANNQNSFFDLNPGDSVSDVLTALDNGNDTELLANTATDGWLVIANLENTDHDSIQQRIDDGSILYDYGVAAFDVPDVFLA